MEFQAWPKTPRLNRDIIITEKIDGTNSAVIIEKAEGDYNIALENVPEGAKAVVTPGTAPDFEDSHVYFVGAQSRNRLITPGKETDNFGFAGWVFDHAEALVANLGPGRHFGEWWGQGIARKYGMDHKVFSLFNVERYSHIRGSLDLRLVPELYRGPFDQDEISSAVVHLRLFGSLAAPGFMKPEGIIVFHTAAQSVFKVTLENDEAPKGLAA